MTTPNNEIQSYSFCHVLSFVTATGTAFFTSLLQFLVQMSSFLSSLRNVEIKVMLALPIDYPAISILFWAIFNN